MFASSLPLFYFPLPSPASCTGLPALVGNLLLCSYLLCDDRQVRKALALLPALWQHAPVPAVG